ncbi:MAG: single-stranded DNA-binding protein [Comamonas sp.]|nr:single-stranded DNA-binding protein [Comamonas sp.]MPS93166.1 single-stranded DNA-binding protein [Comamonas sp.]
MMDGLIAGRLHGQPEQRMGRNDKPFVIAKVRAASASGDVLFANCIAFAPDAVAALLALGDGDSIALAGELTPKAWADRNGEARAGLDVVVHAVLTSYHVQRKRRAMQQGQNDELQD